MSGIFEFLLGYAILLAFWGIINILFYILSLIFRIKFTAVPILIHTIITWCLQIYFIVYPIYIFFLLIWSKEWILFILAVLFIGFLVSWWQFIYGLLLTPFSLVTYYFTERVERVLGGTNPIDDNSRHEIIPLNVSEAEKIEEHKAKRRPITFKFKDSDGVEDFRSNGHDFETLSSRCIDVLLNVKGVKGDKQLDNLLGKAKDEYEGWQLDKALVNLTLAIEKNHALEPYLYYYKRVCLRVLSIPLTEKESTYEKQRDKYISRISHTPKWLRWIIPKIGEYARCKWCGRYTEYVSPNDNSFGFLAGGANSCKYCGMSYPMTSWVWDSPDGRAYSYYRQSFPRGNGGKQFYDEFLSDYDPKPTVEDSGFFSKK